MYPDQSHASWRQKLVTPEKALTKIKPGMSIFLGTGVAEPRTLIKALVTSKTGNIQDLELLQLVSVGDVISTEDRYRPRFRLKTFFSGWVASEAVTSGRVDLIPSRFSRIPALIDSGKIKIDAAFVQITPPDAAGYASLGVSVDVARQAMEQASLVVGEINDRLPWTFGDTFVHLNDFDYLIEAGEPLLYFPRPRLEGVFEKLGENVASLIQDGSCITFGLGLLFESLSKSLAGKRDLGVITPLFTDALMDLVKSGAVTNRRKRSFRGKCLTSYAIGTQELMQWLHRNPLVEFQGIDVVGDPTRVGRNERFVVILPARKIDLTGSIALPTGRGNVSAGPGEAQEFFTGAAFSPSGRTIFALPSRNRQGKPNILLSVEDLPDQFSSREALDLVVTEYGVASLTGRTIRERALALIDIAHPEDRIDLVRLAKEKHLLYPEQVYLQESACLYPAELSWVHTFKDQLTIRFRSIRPSDVDEMRRLFYRFSDRSVYYRYFSPVKTMPHAKMQDYVNIDYQKTMSIVGLVGDPGEGRIVAEARYVCYKDRPRADVAFVVDEVFQGKGIASYLFERLIETAKDKGIKGFEAEVLADNKPMMKVFEKAPYPYQAVLNAGVYKLIIPFTEEGEESDAIAIGKR